MTEDEVQAEARSLAREAGFDPDEIVVGDEPEPVVYDRGDGVPLISMHRPLRARWTTFESEARTRLQERAGDAGQA